MTEIVLGSVYGGRLNLFGDQGNILVLRRFLESAGHTVQVRAVHSTDDALACHFLLVGHGSFAAMESIDEALAALDWQRILSRIPTLAVGSGLEWLGQRFFASANPWQNAERESVFEVVDFEAPAETMCVLGYRNSTSSFRGFSILANKGAGIGLYGTMLHGPVLAKNPRLIRVLANAVCKATGVELEPAAPEAREVHEKWVETLNSVAERIWALEAPDEEFPSL